MRKRSSALMGRLGMAVRLPRYRWTTRRTVLRIAVIESRNRSDESARNSLTQCGSFLAKRACCNPRDSLRVLNLEFKPKGSRTIMRDGECGVLALAEGENPRAAIWHWPRVRKAAWGS